MLNKIKSIWHGLDLKRQFALAAIAILVPGMAVMGWWISNRISEAVINNTASATLIYMDGLIAPLVNEIHKSDTLTLESRAKLDGLLAQSRADSRIVSIKIWRKDGTIIYSSFHQMIGLKFPPSESFNKALAGSIGADYEDGPHDEDAPERATGRRLLEVYAPVREPKSREIIAVSEFYANGDQLGADITSASLASWSIVGVITVLMVSLLSLIVSRGSETILVQKHELGHKVNELEGLLLQNEGLRTSLRKANEDVATVNERVLQQVGSNLHDGPAQMLSYALLRLPSLRRAAKARGNADKEYDNVKRILGDTLQDIRKVSTGLMLPELENASLREVILLAIETHCEHTNTHVESELSQTCGDVSDALKNCAYRIVQEGLSNAFKHAGGKNQKVRLDCNQYLEIEVQDSGPGYSGLEHSKSRLGISGMKARVEALGGSLSFERPTQGGTIMRAHFPPVAVGKGNPKL